MASLIMLSWPLFALVFFARLPVLQAIIWSVVLPYLFLPEKFEIQIPSLPDLDKTSIISIGLFLGLVVQQRKIGITFPNLGKSMKYLALRRLLFLCAAAFVIGSCFTVMTNREILTFGSVVVQAARPWDVVGITSMFAFTWFPFFCAMKYLGTPQAHRALLTALALAVLGYSLLILFEIRFSPQLHRWVYGYHQHSFLQHIRDGFRPKVFLQHGLWVGFLVFMGLMATVALWRSTKQRKWAWGSVWTFAILVVSENLGALMIAVSMLTVFLFAPQRLQRLCILFISLSVLFFPAMRQSQLVPTGEIVAFADSISPERAQSLEFRLINEDSLLEKAWEKPLYGWGGWGRSQIYSEDGRDISISEGRWIQTLSIYGWVGYIAIFGLLTLPLVFLAIVRYVKALPIETSALALIATGNLLYMIPNSTMTPVGLLVFGAVAGFVIQGNKQDTSKLPSSLKRSMRVGRYVVTESSGPSAATRPDLRSPQALVCLESPYLVCPLKSGPP